MKLMKFEKMPRENVRLCMTCDDIAPWKILKLSSHSFSDTLYSVSYILRYKVFNTTLFGCKWWPFPEFLRFRSIFKQSKVSLLKILYFNFLYNLNHLIDLIYIKKKFCGSNNVLLYNCSLICNITY